MLRKSPGEAPAPIDCQDWWLGGEAGITTAQDGRRCWVCPLKLVTKMLGGGSEKGRLDTVPSARINGKMIRGQLRFWWRQTRHGFAADETARLEESIFGSTNARSPLEVRVRITKQGNVRQPSANQRAEVNCNNKSYDLTDIEKYALFVLNTSDTERVPQLCERLEFKVLLTWQANGTISDDQIRNAVNAWVAYGGVGARTRRGVGAIGWNPEVTSSQPDVVLAPPLPQTRLLIKDKGHDTASQPWNEVLKMYRDFRQGYAHNGSTPRDMTDPGRTSWPEPDTIRNITGICQVGHEPVREDNLVPRGLLGMPISFKFKQPPGKQNLGREPDETELWPAADEQHDSADRKRLASPVITRPIYLEGAWHAGMLILPLDHLKGLKLRFKNQADPTPALQAWNLPNDLRPPLRGHSNVFDALMAHAKKETYGFHERRTE